MFGADKAEGERMDEAAGPDRLEPAAHGQGLRFYSKWDGDMMEMSQAGSMKLRLAFLKEHSGCPVNWVHVGRRGRQAQ